MITYLIIIGYIMIGILYCGYNHEAVSKAGKEMSPNVKLIGNILFIIIWPITLLYELGVLLSTIRKSK